MRCGEEDVVSLQGCPQEVFQVNQTWRLAGSFVIVMLPMAGLCGTARAATTDLLQALQEGTISAEFRGTGDLGVDAVIGRNPGGPGFVTISPGTQFWAQTPRRQGMTTLGWVPVDLSSQSVVQLRIPTACTNINLRAPDAEDEMFPAPPPDLRLATLAGLVQPDEDNIHAVQLAVWAVANNAPRHAVLRQVEYMLDTDFVDDDARQAAFDALVPTAAALLHRASLEPTAYRLFR
jgi:hypothetical protein